MELTGFQPGLNPVEVFGSAVYFEYLKVRFQGLTSLDNMKPFCLADNFKKLFGDGRIFNIQFDVVHGRCHSKCSLI